MDYAHEQTDIALEALERAIQRVYSQVGKDLTKTLNAFLARFSAADREKQKQVEAGELSEDAYRRWRAGYIAKGKQYQAAAEAAAKIANMANRQAVEVVNGRLPELYALNRNYISYDFFRHGF